MLRIRTGAHYGLRWGMFGFVAAVLTLSSDQSTAAPYADIVVDANLDPVTNTGAFVSWKAARILDNRAEPDQAVLAARSVAHRYAITN